MSPNSREEHVDVYAARDGAMALGGREGGGGGGAWIHEENRNPQLLLAADLYHSSRVAAANCVSILFVVVFN